MPLPKLYLRDYRLLNRMGQLDLAAAAGVPQSVISEAERGGNITLLCLARLADALKVSIPILLGDFPEHHRIPLMWTKWSETKVPVRLQPEEFKEQSNDNA